MTRRNENIVGKAKISQKPAIKKGSLHRTVVIRGTYDFILKLRDGISEDLSTRFLIKAIDLKIDTFL